ncbi:MAG: hypothetical protein MUE74_09960 [Bacteroidales bacterium]|jgi:hypothetical protein|nr:hypothetical protein [Bacteroidales bacterium]
MKKRIYLIIICTLAFLSSRQVSGQNRDLPGMLRHLYNRILFTVSDEEKVRLNDSIVLLMDRYTAADSAFTHNLKDLRFLGQLSSSDSKVRIYTWNLVLREGSNRYFCYLLYKPGKRSQHRVTKLTGENRQEEILTGRVYTPDDWYGALYYAIQPSRKDYVVLGLDFGTNLVSRKIIDILRFNEDGSVVFGKDILFKNGSPLHREVIEYSSEGVVSMRFLKKGLIVFDHIDTFSAGSDNEKSRGAGLSFDGYVYKKGVWTFTEGIDARNPKK